MGASSSKATRSLPKRVTTPPWSGARVSRPVDSLAEASETKNDVIDRDSKDPQFLSKLNQLGPVLVGHRMQVTRPAASADHMYNSRLLSENEAASANPPQNRVQASRLSQLLDERKSVRTARDMEFLAKRFGVDLEKLESISKFLSTPSVHANSLVRDVHKDGGDKQVMKVKQ
ncbi:hypothetical protein GGX14DRAFT_589990 [Mycena pura]|uniref:Uncharacterized protein n=1 Tax=Mycena pura TaxID=153505 RepID=A0AAD6YGL5_9AGAR|nr:hypothetical protein GGX14DRAFT_589990 [Mycena pura]